MHYILTTLAFFVGILLPVQVGVNAELAKYINSPVLAALVSFLVGGMCLILGAVVFKAPTLSQVTSLPTWLWGGGMIGAAAVVLGSILARPKIGALALFTACRAIGAFYFNRPLRLAGFPNSENEYSTFARSTVCGSVDSYSSEKFESSGKGGIKWIAQHS